MSEQEKTRRETLKLAAAVAAFGTALGFRQTAEAKSDATTPPGGPPTPPTTLKFYLGDKAVCTYKLTAADQAQLKVARVDHKFFRGTQHIKLQQM